MEGAARVAGDHPDGILVIVAEPENSRPAFWCPDRNPAEVIAHYLQSMLGGAAVPDPGATAASAAPEDPRRREQLIPEAFREIPQVYGWPEPLRRDSSPLSLLLAGLGFIDDLGSSAPPDARRRPALIRMLLEDGVFIPSDPSDQPSSSSSSCSTRRRRRPSRWDQVGGCLGCRRLQIFRVLTTLDHIAVAYYNAEDAYLNAQDSYHVQTDGVGFELHAHPDSV
uniref:Uncharacterized protein n=1 Tax=Leersia perrieri TaxID=77586 RepID=A0A0D9WJY9_9ORYZ